MNLNGFFSWLGWVWAHNAFWILVIIAVLIVLRVSFQGKVSDWGIFLRVIALAISLILLVTYHQQLIKWATNLAHPAATNPIEALHQAQDDETQSRRLKQQAEEQRILGVNLMRAYNEQFQMLIGPTSPLDVVLFTVVDARTHDEIHATIMVVAEDGLKTPVVYEPGHKKPIMLDRNKSFRIRAYDDISRWSSEISVHYDPRSLNDYVLEIRP